MKIGTRGIIGFRYNGIDKLTYNHWDSYPSWLGVKILEEIKGISPNELKEKAQKIIMINETSQPTREQIQECKQWANTDVSEQTLKEWYCLLREAQGTLIPYLSETLRYMIDSHEFIKDSLSCEWGYIINLGTGKFEVWKGFQKKPQKGNRYGETPDESGYYPSALIKEYELDNHPDPDTFLKEVGKW